MMMKEKKQDRLQCSSFSSFSSLVSVAEGEGDYFDSAVLHAPVLLAEVVDEERSRGE